MASKYSPEQKSATLMILAANYGDVKLTSQQTGIPMRTLFEWKQASIKLQQTNFSRMQQYSADTADEPEDNEFFRLREQLMEHVFTLANSIAEDDDPATLTSRSLAIGRLIDRIIKLDDFIPSTFKEKTVRFEYFYDGSVHQAPPWANPDYNPTVERDGYGQVEKAPLPIATTPDQSTDPEPSTLADTIFGPPNPSETE